MPTTIKLLRGVTVNGKPTKAGTVVRCKPALAQQLISSGAAEPVDFKATFATRYEYAEWLSENGSDADIRAAAAELGIATADKSRDDLLTAIAYSDLPDGASGKPAAPTDPDDPEAKPNSASTPNE